VNKNGDLPVFLAIDVFFFVDSLGLTSRLALGALLIEGISANMSVSSSSNMLAAALVFASFISKNTEFK